MDNAIKLIKQRGTTLLEALVATAIIGIGFIAIFQMVTYSVRSIDVSGERTKINYLSEMILEDLIAYKSSERDNTRLFDILIDDKNNQDVSKILESLIFKKNRLQNRAYFKGILNRALKFYAG